MFASRYAAKYGHLSALRWLVEEKGADLVGTASADGSTTFHWAVYSGHLPTVEYVARTILQQQLRSQEQRLHDGGQQTRMLAVGEESPDDGGGTARAEHPMFAKNRFGCDATHWAAARGSVPVLEWLSDHGFDLSATNAQQHDALAKAAYKGQSAAAEWLRRHHHAKAT
jgi:ankyrin repeat protein